MIFFFVKDSVIFPFYFLLHKLHKPVPPPCPLSPTTPPRIPRQRRQRVKHPQTLGQKHGATVLACREKLLAVGMSREAVADSPYAQTPTVLHHALGTEGVFSVGQEVAKSRLSIHACRSLQRVYAQLRRRESGRERGRGEGEGERRRGREKERSECERKASKERNPKITWRSRSGGAGICIPP